jgi:hypothetical protein
MFAGVYEFICVTIAMVFNICLLVLIVVYLYKGLRYGFPSNPAKSVYVIEVDSMEGIIELHHDIMFFLLFLIVFLCGW